MKILITALLSAALLLLPGTPVNNSTTTPTKVTHVQAVAPEKATEATQAPTEQKAVVEPAAVVIPQQVPQGCAAYVPLLQKYDWNYQVMAAVMQAESNCNPNAVNPTNYDGVGDYGLMQLHGQKIFNPADNVAHAYAIWQRQGYRAWSTYNNGAYLRYL